MRRWAGQALAAASIWALCLTTGCDGFFVPPGSTAAGGTGSGTGDYVFVANASATAQSLAVFAVGSGTLAPVTGSPFALGLVPTSIAVNPTNTIVYVAGSKTTSAGTSYVINAYSIAATGVLSLLTPNVVGTPEVAIAISPDGKWLMALESVGAGTNGAVVDEFQITNSSGQLQPGAGGSSSDPYSTTVQPMDLKFAPNGAYIFAAMGTGGDVVFPFTTSTGQLSAPLWLPPISLATSEQALAVSSDSTRLYIARSSSSGSLGVYAIGPGGSLSAANGSPFVAGKQPLSVVVNKAGTVVYVANQSDNTISNYSVSGTGAVSILNPATDPTVSAPRALAIDNSGNYLLAISNNGSPDLTMYSYDTTTTGKLDLVASAATGVNPTGAVAIATTH